LGLALLLVVWLLPPLLLSVLLSAAPPGALSLSIPLNLPFFLRLSPTWVLSDSWPQSSFLRIPLILLGARILRLLLLPMSVDALRPRPVSLLLAVLSLVLLFLLLAVLLRTARWPVAPVLVEGLSLDSITLLAVLVMGLLAMAVVVVVVLPDALVVIRWLLRSSVFFFSCMACEGVSICS
jgi:hypothetical protein